MENLNLQIKQTAEALRQEMVQLVQALVRAPSETGHEEQTAEVLTGTLRRLGFDEVMVDPYGNVVGVWKGTGGGDSLLFNCHMDQVAAGDLNEWEHPPFDGVVDGGYIHGRGASDTKGAMAPEIYGVYALMKLGVRLKGDVVLTFVIEEEPGDMWGIRMLHEQYLKDRRFALCVLGEATKNDIYLGHRGRVEIELLGRGKMCHSSAPWRGVNAVEKMVPVLAGLDELNRTMPDNAFLGRASQSLIHIDCKPNELCAVPYECLVRYDRRYVPGETSDSILAQVQQVVNACSARDPELDVEARIRTTQHLSYTGRAGEAFMDKPAFETPQDHPMVTKVLQALQGLGQAPGFEKWDFGTDGAYTSVYMGVPTIGYSCCEEQYAHSSKDRVNIDLMVENAAGVAAICMAVCGVGQA